METISNTTCTKCQRCGEWTNYADDEHYKAIAARLADVETDARRWNALWSLERIVADNGLLLWAAQASREVYEQSIDAAIAQEAGRGSA